MPFDRAHYPPDWDQLRSQVLARAKGACEAQLPGGRVCGAPNGARIHRLPGDPEAFWRCPAVGECQCPGAARPVMVVLTTAHTCQDSACARLDHLRAWCQLHHLRYDAPQHRENAARTRATKRRTGRVRAGQQALL